MKKSALFAFCFLFFTITTVAQETAINQDLYKGATVRQAFPDEIVTNVDPLLLKTKYIEVTKPLPSQIIQSTSPSLVKSTKMEVRQAAPSEIIHTTDSKLLKGTTTISNSPIEKKNE